MERTYAVAEDNSTTMNFGEIENAVDEANESNNDSPSEEREELPWVNVAPTTVVSGEVERAIYTGQITNGNGLVEQTDGSWGFIISDPSVQKGSLYEASSRPDDGFAREANGPSTDYRVFDQDDDGFDVSYDSDGEPKAVSNVQTDDFASSEVDGFSEDKILLFVGGLAGQFMTRSLDANGGISAFTTDDGERTNGLIEFPNDWDNGPGDSGLYPRVARYPELREDLEGEEVFFYLGWMGDSQQKYQGRVGRMDDLAETDGSAEDIANAFIGRQTDFDAPEYDSTLAWHDEPENESQSATGTFDLDGGSDDGDFTESEEQFIETVVDAALDDGESVEEAFDGRGGFESTVDRNRNKNMEDGESGIPDDVDSDALLEEINRRNAA